MEDEDDWVYNNNIFFFFSKLIEVLLKIKFNKITHLEATVISYRYVSAFLVTSYYYIECG